MKLIGITCLLALPAFSAVTTLPTAPTGFEWQLVASGLTDSAVADVSGVESTLEAALGLSGSAPAPAAPAGSGSETSTLAAFGSANPASYSVGDTVDLVTANTYAATLSISITSGVQNIDGDILLLESKLSSVQISSSLGASAPGSDVAATGSDDTIIIVGPHASSVATGGSFDQVEGETITFTFTAADELAIAKPFGGPGSSSLPYFVSPTVNPSLRRDTTYDTFELVAIPEPSSSLLLVLSAFGILGFRRRA